MSWPEVITIGAIVALSAGYVLKRFFGASKGEKGSCKSCSDTCGCAIHEAMSQQEKRTPASGE